jgi:hypothetical protein
MKPGARKDNFLTVAYTWSHENTPHEGFLLVGNDSSDEVATVAWVDSWHMNGKVMLRPIPTGSGSPGRLFPQIPVAAGRTMHPESN